MANPDTKAKRHAYYLANREHILAAVVARAKSKSAEIKAYRKVYAEKNRERILAAKRLYRERNPEVVAQSSRTYYRANSERLKASVKAYAAANKDKLRATRRKWEKKNRTKLAAMKLEWQYADYRRNPERYKEIQGRRKAQKVGSQTEKVDLQKILLDSKGLCGICGEPFDLFGIDFDHIIPLAKGGAHVASNIQATHARCNRSKGARVS